MYFNVHVGNPVNVNCIQNITVLTIKNESLCENRGNTHSLPMKGFQKNLLY